MAKMKELNELVAELKSCGSVLADLADFLQSAFSSTEEKANEADTKKEEGKKPEAKEEKTYTLVEVRKVLSLKSREGHTAEVKALLTELGANTLSEVKAEDYAELIRKAEAL